MCLGRRLACELMLQLACQRGSSRHLLEWVDLVLTAAADEVQNKSLMETDYICISESMVNEAISNMRSAAVSGDGRTCRHIPISVADDGSKIRLHRAAMLIMQEVNATHFCLRVLDRYSL